MIKMIKFKPAKIQHRNAQRKHKKERNGFESLSDIKKSLKNILNVKGIKMSPINLANRTYLLLKLRCYVP